MNIDTHFDYKHLFVFLSTHTKMAPHMEKVSITMQIEHEIADSACRK